MKNTLIIFSVLISVIVWCAAGIAVAGPQQGLLVSETGDVMAGYCPLIIDGDLAYPVRNLETGRWYNVYIVHRTADGEILCTVGEPLDEIPDGVAADETESGDEVTDDDSTDYED
ncbi:MAG: hypothetical protein JW765_12980 [Deltaproteobacteria bacterium]|nr:hypothetical protein [Candidatus Zymogenaceae bacterium]